MVIGPHREGGRHGSVAPGPQQSRADRPVSSPSSVAACVVARSGGRAAAQRRSSDRHDTLRVLDVVERLVPVTPSSPRRHRGRPGCGRRPSTATLIACTTGKAASLRAAVRASTSATRPCGGTSAPVGRPRRPAANRRSSDGLIAGLVDRRRYIKVFDPATRTAVHGVGRGGRLRRPPRPSTARRSSGRTTAAATPTSTRATFDRATTQPTGGDAFPICTARRRPDGPGRRRRHRRLAGRAQRRPGHLRLRASPTKREYAVCTAPGDQTRPGRRAADLVVWQDEPRRPVGHLLPTTSRRRRSFRSASTARRADAAGRLQRPRRLAGLPAARVGRQQDGGPVRRYHSPHVYAVQRRPRARSWARSSGPPVRQARGAARRQRQHRRVRGHGQAGRRA